MTKKLSKRNPQSQSQSTQPHTRAGSPQLTTATDTTNTSPVGITAALHSVVSLLVVLATIYTGYYLGRYLASLSVSPSLSAYRSAVDFEEHNVVRVHAGIPMLFLKEKNEPRVLLNTYISKEVPRWTAADIAHLMTTPEITGVYRSNQSAIFGTFYDNNRPMRTLPTVHNSIRYEKDVTLTKQTLAATFPPHSTDSRAPHHILATALATIDPSLETRMDIRELISLNPSKSAVNLWMSSPGSVTPCHFDGYYNMYLQLSGTKRFTLLRPDARTSLSMFPFLHPSFGQCKHPLLDEASGVRGEAVPSSQWAERVQVVLQPGEMLFIPPHWLHEVESESTSVSVNFWSDISTSAMLQKIFEMDVPGLSWQQFDPSLPIPLTAEDMTTLPVHLSTLTGRYMLGYVIAIEVVEGCLGKAKTRAVLADVFSRYEHLIRDEVLIELPRIMQEPLVDLLSHWKVPLIAKKKASKYTELIGDDVLTGKVKEYIKTMISMFKSADFNRQAITLGHYVEFLSERICSTRRASTFISLIHQAYTMHINNAKK